ncbi:J domain-containing protein, partial [Haematococcus lacustris]
MPMLNTPDGQRVMRILDEAKQCMATYTQRRSPIQAPKAHLARLPEPAPTNSPNTPAGPCAPRLPTVSLSPPRLHTVSHSPPRLPTAPLSSQRMPTAPFNPLRLPTAPVNPPRLPPAPLSPPHLPTARSSPAQSPTTKRVPSPQSPSLQQQHLLQPPHQQQPHPHRPHPKQPHPQLPHPQQPHSQQPHPQQPRHQQSHPQQPHSQQPRRPNLWSPVGLAYEHVRAIPIRHLAKKGLSLYNVLGDGNCFFHASCVWQGTYHPQAHADEREATAHFAENLVQLYQKLVAANQVPPDLPPLMSVLPHNQTEPIPLGL